MKSDDKNWKKLNHSEEADIVHWGQTSFNCPHNLRSDDIIDILEDWEKGHVDAEEVQRFSFLLAEVGGGWPSYRIRFVPSVWFEIMELLEVMEAGPLLKKDMSLFKYVLEKSHEAPEEANKELDAYLDSIDWNNRDPLT